jgi:long-chain acyl-CoA synthetase
MNNPIQHLYFWAKCQPDHVAIQRLEGAITWRQLLDAVRGVAFRFRKMGIKPGDLVVTCLPNLQTDWIITLALMHESAVSCSNHGYSAFPAELDEPWVVANRAMDSIPSSKFILLDGSWKHDGSKLPDGFGPISFSDNNALFRLVLTSGTTGVSKAVEIKLGDLLDRCHLTTVVHYNPGEICMMALSTMGGLFIAMRKLLRGGVLNHFTSLEDLICLVDRFKIEALSGSPFQLANLAKAAGKSSLRMTSLRKIWYAGSAASANLLEILRRELCPNLVCLYGSTEVGSVTTYQAHDPTVSRQGMVGYVVPAAEVQIVNSDHCPVADGEEGVIRTRTPHMAKGYYRNPKETARFFFDGWFYPGDRGVIDDGKLFLSGRESELVNRGGVKINPAEVDRHLLDYEGVHDAATFGYENADGFEDLCAVIVVEDGFDMDQFKRHLGGHLGRAKLPSTIFRVAEIPRNTMGKILRAQLKAQFSERLKQQLREKS